MLTEAAIGTLEHYRLLVHSVIRHITRLWSYSKCKMRMMGDPLASTLYFGQHFEPHGQFYCEILCQTDYLNDYAVLMNYHFIIPIVPCALWPTFFQSCSMQEHLPPAKTSHQNCVVNEHSKTKEVLVHNRNVDNGLYYCYACIIILLRLF